MKSGLKFTPRLILLVAFVMLFNFVLIWLFGSLFLERFYLEDKKNALLAGYKKAQTAYLEGEQSLNQALIDLQAQNIRVTSVNKASRVLEVSTSPSTIGVNIFGVVFVDTDSFDKILNGREFAYIETNNRTVIRNMDGSKQLRLIGSVGDVAYLIVDTPLQPMQEASALAIRFTLIVGAIAAVVGIAVAAILATFMTRPIRQMTHVAQNLAGLDFSERVRVTSTGDEVGTLGQSLNVMADALERYTHEVNSTNQQLKKDIEERLNAERSQRVLVSNISHELKTPLSLISGYAEGLKTGIADDPCARDEYCDVILEESNRMTQMLYKLLRLARLQSDTHPVTREAINLSEMTNDMLDGLSLQIKQKNISIERDYPPNQEILAEQEAAEQVLRNFLQNALRHTPENGRIRISMESATNLRLEVYNSGSHVDEGDMERIWESFYRADESRNRDNGEVGLGLSIVKAHMVRHGMPFGVYNTEDGVVFFAHWPV